MDNEKLKFALDLSDFKRFFEMYTVNSKTMTATVKRIRYTISGLILFLIGLMYWLSPSIEIFLGGVQELYFEGDYLVSVNPVRVLKFKTSVLGPVDENPDMVCFFLRKVWRTSFRGPNC